MALATLYGERERLGSGTQPVVVDLVERLGPERFRVTADRELRAGDALHFGDQSNRVCLLGTVNGTVSTVHEDGSADVTFEFYGAALDELLDALAPD